MSQEVNEERHLAQYITFWVDEEAFGVEMRLVQEVIPLIDITKVYKAEKYILGIINLRGQIVTIMDIFSKLFGENSSKEVSEYGKIIIVNLKSEQIGIAVKDVGEVIESEEIETPPSNIIESAKPYFRGVIRKGEKTISILDLEAMFHD